MAWLADHWFALLLLGGYAALIAHHALVGRRHTADVTDYYVGGRRLGGLVLGLSFFATYSSTNSFVGLAGMSHVLGAPWLLLTPCAVLFSILAWRVVAPRLRAFTAAMDSVTIPDFLGVRFGSETARVLSAVIVIVASFLYMTAVYKGIGHLLTALLDLSYPVAIGLVFVIVVAYTCIGGFLSVVKTDAVQSVFMIAAAILLFFGTTRAAGGITALFAMAEAPATRHLFAWDTGRTFPVILGLLVAGTMKLMVEPRQLSRFYALQDARATRRGMVVSTLCFLGVYALLAPIDLYAWAVFPGGLDSPDEVVPGLLADPQVFPAFLGAFLMVAMIAAAMSSLDSVLLVTATTMQRDIVGRWRGAARNPLGATRIQVAGLALVSAGLALDPPGHIITLTAFSGSLFAACFFPAIVLGLHWRRGTGAAATGSILVGLATVIGWQLSPLADHLHEVFPGVAFSTLAYVLLARGRSPSAEVQSLLGRRE